jgi:hypothetical protein
MNTNFCVPRTLNQICGVFGFPHLKKHATFHMLTDIDFNNLELVGLFSPMTYKQLMKKHFQQRMSWLPCR